MNKNSHAITFLIAAAVVLAVCAGCASAPTSTPTALPTVVQSASSTNPPAPPTSTRVAPTSTSAPTLAIPTATQAVPTPTAGPTKERVTFKSGDLTLVGFLFKPSGQGPFPGIIWNHGSEKSPGTGPEFDSVASIFVPAGYVVFAPMRRGHGDSQGDYIQDQLDQVLKSQGAAAAQQFFVQQMEGPQLDDQLAGQAYLKSLPYVDKNRLAVVGCSYGGIQTVLAAERGAGYKAAVAESPGAESWEGHKSLQDRLVKAVSGINMPVYLLHPEKDASVAPGYTLAQEFLRLGKPYAFQIFPPFGPDNEQGHCFGGAPGYHWWGSDVLKFLADALSPNSAAVQPAPTANLNKQKITLQSDGLTLVSYLYKPNGNGPFPGIIWNHGSEQHPDTSAEFDKIASVFVPAGYVVVDPVRRGQGESQGQYIDDQVVQEAQAHGKAAGAQLLVQLMEGPQLDDQLAGLAYLKNLPYVDKNRLAVVGCSYGGIQTLLGAERGAGYKAAIAMSPGAESWNGNKPLEDRLIRAVSGINIPVLIIHPAKDASLAPGYALGPEFQRLNKPYGLKIFPPFGSETSQGHCFGGEGSQIWSPDALAFLSNVLH